MKRLVTMDGITITTGSTYDNVVHLSPDFLKKVGELYEGTRLGRQELQGTMILDPQNALFKDDWLIRDEVAGDSIEQVTVGVDGESRLPHWSSQIGRVLTHLRVENARHKISALVFVGDAMEEIPADPYAARISVFRSFSFKKATIRR